MKIKVTNCYLTHDLKYTMIGYSTKFKTLKIRIKEQRPDIDMLQLRRFPKKNYLIIEYVEDGVEKVEKYKIKRGFTFDTASVPKWMKWLIDNDGLLLIPSIYHDGSTALHFHSFRKTQKLFRALIRYFGGKYSVSKWQLKSNVAFLGVRSFVGKRIYFSIKPEDHFNYGLFNEVKL